MKEYWINVYHNHKLGFPYCSKNAAEDAAFHVYLNKCLYRIHVRMK